jgi:hypothetical protein
MSGAGAIESSVTLDEVFAVLGAKRVPLAPELAGYLVLEIAEHADPGGGDVDPRAVFVGEEGTVALVKRRDSATGDVEASVRSVLARLLDASGAQTPALAAASKRRSGSGLAALAAELETALIPVNRAAGRRALARLAREVRRILLGVGRNALPSTSDATTSPRRSIPPAPADVSRAGFAQEEATTTKRPAPGDLIAASSPWPEAPTTQFDAPHRPVSPSQDDVDALIDQFAVTAEGEQENASALKAMAGLEPTPPPPPLRPGEPLASLASRVTSRGARSTDEDAEVESLLAMTGGAPSRPPLAREAREAREAQQAHERVAEARQVPTQPARRPRATLPSVPVMVSRKRSNLPILIAFVAVGGGGYAAWALRPGAAARTIPSAEMAVADVPSTPRPAPACVGALVVTNVPAHAEVLLREGQAPVDVEKMPVGARLEFVATAEGYAPKRVVVPQGTGWDPGPDGKPRYEAAVQLDKSVAKAGLDTWPSGEPGSEVGGQGPPGTVHVVATPRGAEVWMLAGMGPEARVEQIRCDRDVDVLIAGPTTYRHRLHVASNAFAPEEGGAGASKAPVRVARVSAK